VSENENPTRRSDDDDRRGGGSRRDSRGSGDRRGGGRRDSRGSNDRRGGGDRRGGRGRRRREDYFVTSNSVPSYKDVDVLGRFLTDRAKIRPRRQTGLNAKNQRKLAREIKRARHLALLPFTDEQTRR
jgi:small subunit ribosomal protein S18